jgi:hypothetical protein
MGSGSVHVFDANGVYLDTIVSPEPEEDGFGCSIATFEDTIVIGDCSALADGIEGAGKVHVFDVDGNLFVTLQSPEPKEGAMFGVSVAVNNDCIFVGETFEDAWEAVLDGEVDEEDVDAVGNVHVYNRDGEYLATLQSSEPTDGTGFGFVVSIFKDMIVVSEFATINEDPNAGRVYFFKEGTLAFDLSGLKVDPSSVKEGGSVSISCDVANTGTLSGSHTVTLKIEGEVKDEKKVSLDAGGSETVSFEVACDSVGVFNVDVNGETGSYTVEQTSFIDRIPGFPIESIIIGLALLVLSMWLIQRKQLIP